MERYLDLARYPIHKPDCSFARSLVASCQHDYNTLGMFNLPGFVLTEVVRECIAGIQPLLDAASFVHCRDHNIYFDDGFSELDPDHPALSILHTENRKICADQFTENLITKIYEWRPLIDFIAAVLEKPQLHTMDDPLARINVMEYSAGQVLNWHFDRAEFTTTLLLQNATSGGEFQYRADLRSDEDPNYDGVGLMLAGQDDQVKTVPLIPGTLNVFQGRNSAHRITPVSGIKSRIIAVFSYYETPGAAFSNKERMYFYGRIGKQVGRFNERLSV